MLCFRTIDPRWNAGFTDLAFTLATHFTSQVILSLLALGLGLEMPGGELFGWNRKSLPSNKPFTVTSPYR